MSICGLSQHQLKDFRIRNERGICKGLLPDKVTVCNAHYTSHRAAALHVTSANVVTCGLSQQQVQVFSTHNDQGICQGLLSDKVTLCDAHITFHPLTSPSEYVSSATVIKFWQDLFEWKSLSTNENIIQVNCIYRYNNIGDHPLLFIRDCYEDIYQLSKIWQFIFITGTTGVGSTIFRNYVVGRQINQAKIDKSSGIYLLGKTPQMGTQTYVMIMINGIMKHYFSFGTAALAIDYIRERFDGLKMYAHYDVSMGDSRDIAPNLSNSQIFFYTSSEELAWKEWIKDKCSVFLLPCWKLDELVDFYSHCKMTPELLKLLALAKQLDIESPSGYESYYNSRLNTFVNLIPQKSSSLIPMDPNLAILRRVIEVECAIVGPIPRNMFLQFGSLITLYTEIKNSVYKFRNTLKPNLSLIVLRNKVINESRSPYLPINNKFEFLSDHIASLCSNALGREFEFDLTW